MFSMSGELKKKKKRLTPNSDLTGKYFFYLFFLFEESFVVFFGFIKGPSDEFPWAHGPKL